MLRFLAVAIVMILTALPTAAGFKVGMAAYERGDYAIALREFKPLAEKGDARAQFQIGLLYYEGRSVQQNPREAIRWWQRAAEQGYAEAQYSLGVVYGYGHGAPQNVSEAAIWFRKAAMQGHARAQMALAGMYKRGQGVPKSDLEAAKWRRKGLKGLRSSARRGDAKAQFALGNSYEAGQSYREAAKWYRKAAEQGYAYAQINLGGMYSEGEGVPKDYVLAYFWWSLAVAAGQHTAKLNLKSLERHMTAAQVAKAKEMAAKWRPKKAKPAK